MHLLVELIGKWVLLVFCTAGVVLVAGVRFRDIDETYMAVGGEGDEVGAQLGEKRNCVHRVAENHRRYEYLQQTVPRTIGYLIISTVNRTENHRMPDYSKQDRDIRSRSPQRCQHVAPTNQTSSIPREASFSLPIRYDVPFNAFFQYIIIRIRKAKLCLRV